MGGGVHLVSSSLVLVTRNREQSSINFRSNLAKLGGGVCLEESSKLYTTTDKVVIDFTSNRANFGGAIYVSDDTNNGTCTSSEYTLTNTAESDCFFQSIRYNPYSGNSRISNIINSHISFSDNTANTSGAILYGGLLDRCTVNVFDRKAYIKIMYSSQPNFTKGILNYTSSDAVRICFCERIGAEVNCSYQPEPIQVVKGRNFTLNVAAVDPVNHTLNHVTVHSYLSHKDNRLGKGQKAQTIDLLKCSVLTFRAYTVLKKEFMIIYPSGPCRDANMSRRSVLINFLPCICPVGFEPSKTGLYTCICECHSKLLKFVTSCDQSTTLVHRKGDAWITALMKQTILFTLIAPLIIAFLPPWILVSISMSQPDLMLNVAIIDQDFYAACVNQGSVFP
jgi:predicted outer membrane repeat protein